MYRNYDKTSFYNDIKLTKEKALSPLQLKVELAKIISKFKDAHTSIFFNKKTIIELRKIGNEVYIIDDYKNNVSNFLYKKITYINGIDINVVINKVFECFPNETDSFSDYFLEQNLLSFELLKGLDIAKDNIIITLVDGTTINYNEELKKEYVKDIIYFENKVIDGDIYYIKYGTCNNIGNFDIEKWFDSIINELKELGFKKVIIDLRGNTGGSSRYFSSFAKKLKEEFEALTYVTLVDNAVFSSGVFALNDMINLGSYIIGNKIGTTKNHFGYVTMLNISDFAISCSNSEWLLKEGKYIRYKKDEEIPSEIIKREEFNIDHFVEENIDDYVSNIDPYLTIALEYLEIKKTF